MRSIQRRLYTRPATMAAINRDPRWLRWLKRLVMTLGTITLFMFLFGLLTRCATTRIEALPSKFVLTAQFTGAWNEKPDRLAFFAPPEDDFYNVLATLKEGAKDPRVKALIVHIWNGQYSLSQIKEIRAALNEWRAAGKTTYAYSYSLGDGATGMGAYWLATAFDKIWVQDLGFVTMNGFRAEMPFARGALEKLGVQPEFFAYTTYKSAMDMFSRSSIGEADRKQLTFMLNGLNDDFITDVSAARSLPVTEIRKAITGAPYMATDAVKLKLIDQAGYGDELGARIRLGLQDDRMPFVSILNYMPDALNRVLRSQGKTKIALINIEGEINDAMIMPLEAQDKGGVLSGGGELCVSCAILAASDDRNIKAILLRVNTPGGSPTASETIRRAMIIARAKGKNVVVSMGDVAASGGYWIASGADKIIAYPTTITGSIGVVGGKFAARELFSKYGVNFDEVSSDVKAPNMGSFITPFSAEAEARQKKNLQAIYDAFKVRVAQGRPCVRDVEKIAQGRVWLGKDALKIGLVDQLGGLDVAKNTIANLLNLKSANDLALIPYMPQPSPLGGLKKLLGLPGVVMKLQNEWMKATAFVNNNSSQIKMDIPQIID